MNLKGPAFDGLPPAVRPAISIQLENSKCKIISNKFGFKAEKVQKSIEEEIDEIVEEEKGVKPQSKFRFSSVPILFLAIQTCFCDFFTYNCRKRKKR